MSANIVFRDASAPSDPDASLGLRYENTVSTPLSAVTLLGNGEEVAGVYTLVFTNNAGVISVDVTAEDPKNPYAGTGKPFTDDGVTENKDVIPGLSIVGSGTIDTGHTAVVSIGALMATDGSTTARFNAGIIDAGSTTTGFRVAAVNVGSEDAALATVRALPGFWWTPSSAGDFVKEIAPHTDSVREVLAAPGTYTITFQNWTDGTGAKAGYKIADIYVNGSLCVAGAMFDGTTRYQYGQADYVDASDLLAGLSIVLQNTTADPTAQTITLIVTDSDQWVEFADDNSGSPGTYGAGPLTITEPGQPSGVVTVSGTAYFWVRYSLPDDATPVSTQRAFRIRSRVKSI